MVRKKLGRGRKNRCRFCTKDGCPRPAFVDYKDVQTLKKLCTSQGKLFSRKRSGNCAAFQRAVKDAVKRARFMALMPYVDEYRRLLSSRGPRSRKISDTGFLRRSSLVHFAQDPLRSGESRLSRSLLA